MMNDDNGDDDEILMMKAMERHIIAAYGLVFCKIYYEECRR